MSVILGLRLIAKFPLLDTYEKLLGSSNFATNFNGSSKFRDDGKLMSIVKIKGEWVKELPAEGEELSNEWLEKKLAEIDSLEEAE